MITGFWVIVPALHGTYQYCWSAKLAKLQLPFSADIIYGWPLGPMNLLREYFTFQAGQPGWRLEDASALHVGS